jgi:anti-sigma B factor antagonist/stage II sporulation protein AA (anti-sigma F factor antagonist)
MGVGLNIHIEDKENKKVLRIEGRVDALSAPVLDAKMNALLDDGNERLAVDFSRVDYLSSAGLRVMLSTTKKWKAKGGSVVFFSMNEDIMEIIRLAGFERILTICPTESLALSSLNK